MWNIEATINDGISWELFPVYWWRGKEGALACFNQSSINIIHGWTDIWNHRLDPIPPWTAKRILHILVGISIRLDIVQIFSPMPVTYSV